MLALRPIETFGTLLDLFDPFVIEDEFSALDRQIVPRLEHEETDEAYIVRAEMPGVPKEKVELTLKENAVTLRSKEENEEKDEKGNVVRSFYRSYSTTFVVPGRFKHDAVKAEAKEGIVTITFPKSEEAKPREITVK